METKLQDSRNADIQVFVGGEILPRQKAKVSVFDSSVQGGDAVWEGLRVYQGRIFKLDEHLERLIDSAKAMAFTQIPAKEDIKKAVFETLRANNMRDGVHIRLTLTRGLKTTSNMDPRVNQYGPCLIVLPEWKQPRFSSEGIRLITSAIRRNTPQCIDSKIHHNNLINNILAKIEAIAAGVDEALMLDIYGFVSETNSTNVFLVKRNELLTPHADACLPGITRAEVIDVARQNRIPLAERNISISEVYSADEMLCTGTVGELTPVLEVDGRLIGEARPGEITQQLRELYAERTSTQGDPLPF